MSENWKKDYTELMKKVKELVLLQSTGALVHWDMETKMPPKAISLRSEQLAQIQKIAHKMSTDPEIGKILNRIDRNSNFKVADQIKRRNIHLVRKNYNEATKLPENLVVELAKQRTISVNTWKNAKNKQNWSMFKPELKKIKDLTEKAADILMEVKGTRTPYDALIDIYEPKMSATIISKYFTEMRKGLNSIITKIDSSEKPEVGFMNRLVPKEKQVMIAKSIVKFIEYDTNSTTAGGRIDETEHPFTTGYYDDVRITTNYSDNMFASSLYSILHEGGHAIYDMSLPREWIYQPVGMGASMGIHESMSRFVENIVGRSLEFWDYYMPILKKLTDDTFIDITKEQMISAVNFVTPNKIRIEADEVTYGIHIIIRFELERDLFNGDLKIDELPQVWNQKYKDYLGVDIKHDSEGVMQDTHWAGGSFGYFPSYALGNLYTGMWLSKLNKELSEWKQLISKGSFREIKKWLNENVFRYGNLYDPEDLVKTVTGKTLDVKPFINYLETKFQAIYGY
jgi:carboxypeptidase Taq